MSQTPNRDRLRRFPVLQSAIPAAAGITSGLLLSEAFPPHELTWLAWIALLPLAFLLTRPKASLELYAGAFLGTAMFHALGLDFLRTSGGAGSSLSLLRWWGLSVVLTTIPWLLIFPLARRTVSGSRWPMGVCLPIVWLTFEYARYQIGYVANDTPIPWLQLGSTQIDRLYLAQAADLGGVWLITGLVAGVNGALYDAANGIAQRRPRRALLGLVPYAGLILAVNVYGAWRIESAPSSPGPKVWLMTSSPLSLGLGTDSKELPRGVVLLWAETVCEIASDRDLERLAEQSRRVASPFLVGCTRPLPGDSGRNRNSVAVFDGQGRSLGFYDKVYPVPWIEFIPTLGLWLGKEPFGVITGREPLCFEIRDEQRPKPLQVAPLICYDTAFGGLAREACRRYPEIDFFTASSNERSDTTLTLQRFMLISARWRAIECRRPIVRNVDCGFSGWIDSCGRYVSQRSSPILAGPTSVGSVPLDGRFSMSVRTGDLVPVLASVIMVENFVSSAWSARRRGSSASR